MTTQTPLVSVIMPCLNEVQSVGICIRKAKAALRKYNITGEIIVADNGSLDNSAAIARRAGAKVIFEKKKGYGSAIRRGIERSKGKYIVIADADNTYDLSEISTIIEPLNRDADLVVGTRLKGRMEIGAMPFLHRHLGNPFLSFYMRLLFGINVSDTHCGFRSITREAYDKLNLKADGMEFASEMLICASKSKMRIEEIPISYHSNKMRKPKLNTLRDGARHIRVMLKNSPLHLFIIPGIMLIALAFLIRGYFLPLFAPGIFAVILGMMPKYKRGFERSAMLLSVSGWVIFLLGITFSIAQETPGAFTFLSLGPGLIFLSFYIAPYYPSSRSEQS